MEKSYILKYLCMDSAAFGLIQINITSVNFTFRTKSGLKSLFNRTKRVCLLSCTDCRISQIHSSLFDMLQ